MGDNKENYYNEILGVKGLKKLRKDGGRLFEMGSFLI